ncbi:MAG: hypothetical protein ACREEM_49295 [Blastocatellia bacterium]
MTRQTISTCLQTMCSRKALLLIAAAMGLALLGARGEGIRGAGNHRGAVQSGTFDRSLVHDGLTRTYRIHIPPSYNPSKPAALVLALHGGGGNGQGMERLTGLTPLSDREGFIVV